MCRVVLADLSPARLALSVLQNACLFNSRISISTLESHLRRKHLDCENILGVQRGWYASNDSPWQDAKLRQPHWTYPSDLFAPLRESRRLILFNLANKAHGQDVSTGFYGFLHEFNVQSVGTRFKYTPQFGELTEYAANVDFATNSDADLALETCSGRVICGLPIRLARCKVPLKYTTSWDTMWRGSGHNTTPRDEGSAVGTNFEEASLRNYPV